MKKSSFLVLILCFVCGCAVNKKVNTMHPFRGDAIGCGDFIVYKLSEDNREYISVAFNSKNVQLTDFQAYGVGKSTILEIKRRKYKDPISASLCNDVMVDKPELIYEESPFDGVVEILVSEEDREKARKNQGYRVTVVLKKVRFEKATMIDYLRIEDVYVGWLPG